MTGLRTKVPVPVQDDAEPGGPALNPAEQIALADTVGVALPVVLNRLTPAERVAFVTSRTGRAQRGSTAAGPVWPSTSPSYAAW